MCPEFGGKAREFLGHVSNRSAGVDDAVRRFGSELQCEFSPGCSHGDILPSDPRVGLLGVYLNPPSVHLKTPPNPKQGK
jgi:hypothetical protein